MDVVPTVSLLVLALLTGFEFCLAVALPVATRGLGPEPRLQARSHAAVALGRLMPPWYAVTAVLAAALAWVRPGVATTATAVALVAVIVGTLFFLVPINSRLAAWSVEDHPADWSVQVARWDARHRVRVGVLAAATLATAVATG